MNQFDIFNSEIEWRDSRDRRPVLILSPQWYLEQHPTQNVLIAPMSSQIDLRDPNIHFPLRQVDPGFPETGLKRSSYVAVNWMMTIECIDLKSRAGRLTGALADDFAFFLVRFLFEDRFSPSEHS